MRSDREPDNEAPLLEYQSHRPVRRSRQELAVTFVVVVVVALLSGFLVALLVWGAPRGHP